MPPVIQHDTDETYDRFGNVTKAAPVDRDVSAAAVTFDLAAKLRAAFVSNQNFLANNAPTNADVLAQVRQLTRQHNALAKLVGADLLGLADLLGDNAGT